MTTRTTRQTSGGATRYDLSNVPETRMDLAAIEENLAATDRGQDEGRGQDPGRDPGQGQDGQDRLATVSTEDSVPLDVAVDEDGRVSARATTVGGALDELDRDQALLDVMEACNK